MKYTNWSKYHPGLFKFLFAFVILLLASPNTWSQPSNSQANPGNGEQIFTQQLDILIEAKSIEISLLLKTKSDNRKVATSEHMQFINELRSRMLDISASVTSAEAQDIDVRQPKFARLQFARPEATSTFIISVTSDRQLADAIGIIKKTKAAEIETYAVIYDDSVGTDDELTTDLTNRLLADIRKTAKETGRELTPRGFSELDIQTNETGRELLERALEGKKIKDWNKSDQRISLIKTTKKVSIGLRAS